MRNGIPEATVAAKLLREFVNPRQLEMLGNLCRGEERQFFIDKMVEMAAIIQAMPETGGSAERTIVHLHYFMGGCDWYIAEKDIGCPDEPGQHQAYGIANLGYGPEAGYISIVELLENNVELDLHFKPRPADEIKS